MAVTIFAAIATVSVEFPVTPLSEAATVVAPEATAVTSPVELIVATAGAATVQLAVAVTSPVEPSLYFAVALNCCVAPIPTLVMDGDTETATGVFVAPAERDETPWHPVLMIMSESERKEREIEIRNQSDEWRSLVLLADRRQKLFLSKRTVAGISSFKAFLLMPWPGGSVVCGFLSTPSRKECVPGAPALSECLRQIQSHGLTSGFAQIGGWRGGIRSTEPTSVAESWGFGRSWPRPRHRERFPRRYPLSFVVCDSAIAL